MNIFSANRSFGSFTLSFEILGALGLGFGFNFYPHVIAFGFTLGPFVVSLAYVTPSQHPEPVAAPECVGDACKVS